LSDDLVAGLEDGDGETVGAEAGPDVLDLLRQSRNGLCPKAGSWKSAKPIPNDGGDCLLPIGLVRFPAYKGSRTRLKMAGLGWGAGIRRQS